jgi:hypothetical protein
MGRGIYAVFGDLHGRVLPAFKLARAWANSHELRVDGILQVGDLGYFPDTARLDKATAKYAMDDPLELGVQLVTQPSAEADQVFNELGVPAAMWFTAGNHEDFDALDSMASRVGSRATSFPVDAYGRVNCIHDGRIANAGNLRIGALWGVSHQTRSGLPSRALIRSKSAQSLMHSQFDVLLTHDCPKDAMVPNSGSDEIEEIIQLAKPRFAFFGHYKGAGSQVSSDFGLTNVYHMAGLEMRRKNQYPETGCMGILRWSGEAGEFSYVDDDWLMGFPRSNWMRWQ